MKTDVIERREIFLNNLESLWECLIHLLQSLEDAKARLFENFFYPRITRNEDKITIWKELFEYLDMKPSKRSISIRDNSYLILCRSKNIQ